MLAIEPNPLAELSALIPELLLLFLATSLLSETDLKERIDLVAKNYREGGRYLRLNAMGFAHEAAQPLAKTVCRTVGGQHAMRDVHCDSAA